MNAIVMYDSNRGIVKNGDQPIHIPKDLMHFKTRTTGDYVVMGRRTAEVIGRPLPNRHTIVITSNPIRFRLMNPTFVCSECEAMTLRKFKDDLFFFRDSDIWVAGGEMLYKQLLPYVETVCATEVKYNFKCDRFFPKLDMLNWKRNSVTPYATYVDEEGNEYEYRFAIYSRRHFHA